MNNKELVINHLNLAHKICNDFYKKDTQIEYDDLKQICYIGLIKACDSFDETKRICF